MNGNNVRIEQENERVTKVYIDGKELKCVNYVEYKNGVDELPVVTVEFTPGTLNFDKEKENLLSVTIDGDVIVGEAIKEINKINKKQAKRGVII